jgi:hypothetical protein
MIENGTMNLKLKKVHYYQHDETHIVITIEASFGYQDKQHTELVRLNYNSQKRDIHCAVKIQSPGIGPVIERIIFGVNSVDYASLSAREGVIKIIDGLHIMLGMEYDGQQITDGLEGPPQ